MNVEEMKSTLERIGTEALGVRILELSFIAQRAKGYVSLHDGIEWESLILERREHLSGKIDEFIALAGLQANETLESLAADRARRARK